jgi:aminoglycoside 2''-phosphotransferase
VNIENLIKEKFNLLINSCKLLGSGYDSQAYLVNNKYIFKIKLSTNKKKGYEKEKAIYDFLNKNLKSNIKIPNIEYSYISDEISMLGYKNIEGTFLTPEIYNAMDDTSKENLKKDIATFLKEIHNLDYSPISEYKIDNKENCLEEYELLKNTIYDKLTTKEQKYIEDFYVKLKSTTIFNNKKCLCHNDFSSNHLLIDINYKLCGVIDFGDSGIIDEYCDFIYLLEDSEEEIGRQFGEDILKIYGDINTDKAKEYQEMVKLYYPIELIVYGLKNKNQDSIDEGREELKLRINN